MILLIAAAKIEITVETPSLQRGSIYLATPFWDFFAKFVHHEHHLT